MKAIKNIYTLALPALVAGVLSVGMTSCEDSPAMAQPHLDVETDVVKTYAMAADYDFNIVSNCDWNITGESDNDSWVTLSTREGIGNTTVVVSVTPNEGDEVRSAVYNIANAAGTVSAKFTVTQTAGGSIVSVADLKELAATDTYTVNEPLTMEAVVVSNPRGGNFFENRMSVVSSFEKGNGIAVVTEEPMYLMAGDGINIDLEGATVGVNAETGILEIKPASDAAITASDNTSCGIKVAEVGSTEIASGDYDGMLVKINCKVHATEMSKKNIAGLTTIQFADNKQFKMGVFPTSSFAGLKVGAKEGTLTGIVSKYNGVRCIMPRSLEDVGLPKGGGIKEFPYVFSLLTNAAANSVGRYVEYKEVAGAINDSYIIDKSGNGVSLTVDISRGRTRPETDLSQWVFKYWHDNSGHHNVQMGTFSEWEKNYALFTFPLDESADLNDGFRIQFGWTSQQYGCMHHLVEYSNDCETWYPISSDEGYNLIPEKSTYSFSIPKKMGSSTPHPSGLYFWPFSFDVKNPQCALDPYGMLFVRVRPANGVGVNGGDIAASGSYARAVWHSCFIVDKLPSFSTSKPADALWFQPFDQLVDGADYLLGEKICALNNFIGPQIETWTPEQSLGMTGVNVAGRPGYAQIGIANNLTIAHTAMTNAVGELCTPAVGVPGDYVITFDAMAYKNKPVFSNTNLDFGGDSKQAIVEVVGGGTIDGATTKVIDDLSYDKFNNYSVTVKGATAATYVKFTSPTDAKFTRWFIDNITVKKP